jgi:hypothetical protein
MSRRAVVKKSSAPKLPDFSASAVSLNRKAPMASFGPIIRTCAFRPVTTTQRFAPLPRPSGLTALGGVAAGLKKTLRSLPQLLHGRMLPVTRPGSAEE